MTEFNKDFYTTLGVANTASPDDIKKAFRIKAALFHPDKNASELAPIRFREIKEAYDILSDAEKRAIYDENRRRHLLTDPLQTATTLWKNYLTGVLT